MYYLCSRFCEAYVQLLSVQIAFTPQAQGVAQAILTYSTSHGGKKRLLILVYLSH